MDSSRHKVGWNPKRGEGDTTTFVPVDSRTTVPEKTQEVLTSGFGMGPGRHLRYGRVQTPLEYESTFPLDRGPHSVVRKKIKKMLERLVLLGYTPRRTLVLTPAVYQTDLLSEL